MKGKNSSKGTTTASHAIKHGEVRERKNVRLEEIFADIECIRTHAKGLPEGMTVKDLIEEGRT